MPFSSESGSVVVPASLDGERLDRAVTELLGGGLSRSQMARRIRDGRVCIDGEVVTKPGFPVTAGQSLAIAGDPAELARTASVPEPRLLFKDDWIAVIDKPAGLPMHGNYAGDRRPSVATWLEERFGPGLPCSQGAERPGIVHRLDRGTSGVCVTAREVRAFEDLQEQFAERSVEKSYEALCYGEARFQSDWVELRLARDEKHPQRMRTTRSTGPESRDAATYWEVARRFSGFTHVRARPRTGRMHQIRVHLCAAGLPIVGDPLYRARNFGPGMLPAGAPPLERMMLHARTLAFEHPVRGGRVRFTSELPRAMAALLDFLADHAPPAEQGWS